MKKYLFLALSLCLVVSAVPAFAADYYSDAGAELQAQWKGNNNVVDTPCNVAVWYDGTYTDAAAIATSNTSIGIYSGAIVYATPSSSYATMGALVDYINSISGWHASIVDSYRSHSTNDFLIKAVGAVGRTYETAYEFPCDTSASIGIAAGARAQDGVVNRIKSLQCTLPVGSGNVTIRILDGNNVIWQKWVSGGASSTGVWNSTTASASSANTIVFSTGPEKGLSSTKGNGLCVEVSSSTALSTDATALSITSISLVYDELRN